MQITIEPNKLSKEQRDAVVKFINEYPIHADTVHRQRMEFEIKADTADAIKNIGALRTAVDEISPEAAFGTKLTGSEIIPSNAVGDLVPVTQVAGGVDLDAKGLPWDNRIHSSNKQKAADGIWRKRRGVNDTIMAQVETELRQLMGAPAAQPLPQAPPPPPPAADPLAIPENLRRAPAPPAPAPAVSDAKQQYITLVGRVAAAVAGGKITQDQITEVCTTNGAISLPLLINRLDLLPQISAEIDAILAFAGA